MVKRQATAKLNQHIVSGEHFAVSSILMLVFIRIRVKEIVHVCKTNISIPTGLLPRELKIEKRKNRNVRDEASGPFPRSLGCARVLLCHVATIFLFALAWCWCCCRCCCRRHRHLQYNKTNCIF